MPAEIDRSVPNERARHLLKVLIERYVRDGQPVGSRTLSRDSGLDLSPATIRNVMSDLEEMGFVSAPHTSAGRVPTALGYRFFVDTLLKLRPLKESEVLRLRQELETLRDDPDSLISSTSSLLSHITRMAGVVSVPRTERVTLRQIEFLPLSDNRVLAILVVNEREVQNRILHTSRTYTDSELRRAANFLNDRYAGSDLETIRRQLVDELEQTRDSMNQTMLDMVAMAHHAFEGAGEHRSDYVLAGETNLMDFAELSDLEKLRRLFEAFNERRFMLDLLDRSIRAQGVQIFIGEESGYNILDDCSVVAAPYVVDEEVIGVLGVIGPSRMAYDRVIPIVDITAKLLGSALNSRP